MGKKKDKKKQSEDVLEDNFTDAASVGAPNITSKEFSKKGKNEKDLDNWEDEMEALTLNDETNQKPSDVDTDKTTSQKSKGKKGKKKKDLDNWEDDVQAEITALSGDADLKDPSDEAVQEDFNESQKPKSKKDKKKKKDDNWEDDIQNEISMLASGEEKPEINQKMDDEKLKEPSQQKSKAKKGKKKKDLDNWEDDIQNEISMLASGGASEPPKDGEEEKQVNLQKQKGKKGKKKNKGDNWKDDIQNEISALALGETADQSRDDDNSKTTQQKSKGKKKSKNENREEDTLNESAVVEDAASQSVKPNSEAKPQDSQQKSKGKKGKKKKEADNWEDDILDEISKIESGEIDLKADDKETEKKPNKKKTSKQEEKKMEVKPTMPVKKEAVAKTTGAEETAPPETDKPAAASNKKKKGKKKGEEEEKAKKKPSKAIKAMQEALRKRKEEEERFMREEEERIRKEEEAYQRKLDELEKERLRKEKKKQDKKDRILRQKKEGTYLTPKQKEEQRRNQAYLERLREQGIEIPPKGTTAKKPKYEHKKKQQFKEKKQVEEASPTVPVQEPKEEPVKEVVVEESNGSEDDWEAIAEDEHPAAESKASKKEERPSSGSQKDESELGSSSEEEEDDSETETEEDEDETKDVSARERILSRIEKLREKNEKNRSPDDLRSPVICVMGHVDTGKTKILDKIRHSNVQDGEAGGITQQIGATNIPVSAIEDQTKMVKNMAKIKVPGLLVIDTPGHESFSNLRSRGSSNCDMAILVVDIMHGLEPQTIESMKMLQKKKTPYVVALNKIDRLYEWKPNPKADVTTTIKSQKPFTKDEFQQRVNETVVQFAEQGLNVKLFYENDDTDVWISMVPTSAHSGDGMGNLMAHVVQHCQTKLAKRLAFSENLQCTVLEVKAIQGLGTTVDVILTNGRLKYGDIIVLPGVEGPIVTHIKALLMPQPLKELRVKNPYDKFKEIKAAQGVKVLAKELDKALAGTSLLVASREDEVDILKEEVQAEVDQALRSIKLQEHGVFVQASTLGSLEALLEFLKQSKIPYAGISIGPVHKRDVMKASVMLDRGQTDQWAVILAFDVKVEREAQDLADNLGVKIFTADIIYHLFDAFMKHREDLKLQKQDEFRHLAVFPCKLKIVPNCVFKSRDPIVVGVTVEAGQLRVGTPVCVPSKDFLNVGIVSSMEFNHKPIEIARKPQEVCIKIDGTPGEAPKMVGRHFDEADILTSKISRESIDLLKSWFRDDMQKGDWQLIIELKKLFEII